MTGTTGLLADRVKHERTAGDCFCVLIRIGQTDEYAPPDYNQRGKPRHVAPTFQVLRGEAATISMVFQRIKVVFGVGTVAIQLGDTENFVVQQGDHDTVFADLHF